MTHFDADEVLHSPFNVKTHKKTFVNYCEVIIWPDGKIEYAVPSHDEKLILAYAEYHGISRDEAIEEIRQFPDYLDHVMKETGIIQVWYDYMHNLTPLTEKQFEAINMLMTSGCVSDRMFDSMTFF